ncbi:AsnC family transcriptional regulator [Amycolatopsis rhizosphaerae]|uniref:AsnC family transcriptional regulator n=1 Tax=Amycolatopsis rhizosphaerae TaxID=2053003 RepID=A0A558CAM9_9PSEU|nr:AsnC family transcriptional regulator [Amycolatopsis rhizosphaerae]TVT45737.1 AsnC family transcriptional regulator [Amycolatopsis rhizosphaerae]
MDEQDLRLIAALQCDGRASTERIARVLGLNVRVARRRLRVLLGDGVVRVVAAPPPERVPAAMSLRVKVLRGRLDAVAAGLAAREDIPFVDVSAAGDEILAVLVGGAQPGNHLVFRQLPATTAVTSVEACTILHLFAAATDWRLDVLTEAERRGLEAGGRFVDRELDEIDNAVLAALGEDARLPASTIAARVGEPESTVRRRLLTLRAERQFVTEAFVEPRRLGLPVDANLLVQVPPGRLDEAGRTLARHPAVHGAFAATGAYNLHVAVWMRDLEELYRFVTADLARLGATAAETVLVGRAVKRPGKPGLLPAMG